MQKKLLLLSAGLILSLASCGGASSATGLSSEGTTQEASASLTSEGEASESAEEISSEETSEDESGKNGRVIIAEDEDTAALYDLEVLPADIGVGTTVDLEKHVKVTGVKNWTIETKSENVEISGHTFKALDYGAYTITIRAGATRRAVNGHVVTPTKLAFDEAFDALELEYMVSGEFTGGIIVNENYWMESAGNERTGYYMTGGISHPTNGKSYSFNLPFGEDEEGLIFADQIEVNKGYGRSVASKGFGTYFEDVSAKEFVQQFDSDGIPTGYFILKCVEVDEYESNVSRFYQSLVGSDSWSDLVYYIVDDYNAKMDLAAKYNTNTGTISFYPADPTTGRVYTKFKYDGQSYKTATNVDLINATKLDACEAWLADPVLPELIDTTDLQAAFDSIFETKAFTLKATGQWYDPSSPIKSKIDVPDGFKFSSGEEVFSNYNTEVHANADIVEKYYNAISRDAYLPDDEYALPSNGDRDMFFVYDNYARTATYSKANASWSAVDTYEEPFSDDPEEEASVWDSTSVPYYFSSDFKYKVLEMASIYDYEEDGDKKIYRYNAFGEDMDIGINQWYAGIPFFLASVTPAMIAYIPVFYLNYLNWYNYCDMAFVVGENSVSFTLDFPAASTYAYRMTWSFEEIGVDNVSEDAKALREEFINPTFPPEEQSSSEEGSIPPEEISSQEEVSIPEDISGEESSQEEITSNEE